MQMLWEGPEVDAAGGPEGTPLPCVGAGPPAVSSLLPAAVARLGGPGGRGAERLTCHLLVSGIANAWLCNCLWSKGSRQEGRLSPAPYLCLHGTEQPQDKDMLRCQLS